VLGAKVIGDPDQLIEVTSKSALDVPVVTGVAPVTGGVTPLTAGILTTLAAFADWNPREVTEIVRIPISIWVRNFLGLLILFILRK
jgi:hypothetical protein